MSVLKGENMSELQDLINQKKELEERIRELRFKARYFGCAKIDIEHYPTIRPDEWYIAIKVPGVMPEDQSRYRSIIRGHSKEECAEKIPQIINDLQGLYEQLTEGAENE